MTWVFGYNVIMTGSGDVALWVISCAAGLIKSCPVYVLY